MVDKMKKLNKFLKRKYNIKYEDNEIVIKNSIYVYELKLIRYWVAQGNLKKCKNIRIEG